jgi:hypothetical protein
MAASGTCTRSVIRTDVAVLSGLIAWAADNTGADRVLFGIDTLLY